MPGKKKCGYIPIYIYGCAIKTKEDGEMGKEVFFPTGENVFPDQAKIFAKQRKINWKREGKMMNVCQNEVPPKS